MSNDWYGEYMSTKPEPVTHKYVLFLDIDGVLNDNTVMDNGWCGIQYTRCKILNKALKNLPNLSIVISSSWRDLIYRGDMTLKGFEQMLLASGLFCSGRLVGITAYQPPAVDMRLDNWREHYFETRVRECEAWAEQHNVEKYVILDDLDLPSEHLVQTNPSVGVSHEEVTKIITYFQQDRTQGR